MPPFMLDNPSESELEWEPVTSDINPRDHEVSDSDDEDESHHDRMSLDSGSESEYMAGDSTDSDDEPTVGDSLEAAQELEQPLAPGMGTKPQGRPRDSDALQVEEEIRHFERQHTVLSVDDDSETLLDEVGHPPRPGTHAGTPKAGQSSCFGRRQTEPLSDDEAMLFDGNRNPPAHYKQGLQDMNEEAFDRKEYAPGTENAINAVEEKWIRFCRQILHEDYMVTYAGINLKVIYQFLDWYLNQTTGMNERKKAGIRSRSSLVTFWCTFRLAYKRARNVRIDKRIDRHRLSNALVELGNKYNLSSEKKGNESMTIDDLKLQLDTILRTTEKSFKLGELRILAILYLLLLAPAGSRPRSILNIRFKDIRVLLVRDPNHGPHRLLIKISLRHTKRYLGAKLTKTFFVPEIIYDPSLLLSPHIFLLGILFKHRAFRSSALNNTPRALSELDIHPNENELPLHLKKSLDDTFLFRQTKKVLSGFAISKKPISQGMMTAWVRRVGELAGFEFSTKCYNLRYMAGNSMDRDENVSDALRNLIMDHAPNSDTFQKHYLNRNVCMDIWAIQRGVQLQQPLIERSTSHGHSQSARRPVSLTAAQSKALNDHPAMLKIRAQKKALLDKGVSAQAAEYQVLSRKLTAKKQSLRSAEMKRIRAQFSEQQALEDIDRQLGGQQASQAAAEEAKSYRPMTQAQRDLVAAIEAPLASLEITAQFQRRANAVDAIIAYCDVEERRVTPVEENVPPPPELQPQAPSEGPAVPPSVSLRESVFVKKRGERLQRCFICISKALMLPPDHPDIDRLCRIHHDPWSIGRHFKNIHLQGVKDNAKNLTCPLCDPVVKLKNKLYLQYHADAVHGIRTIRGAIRMNHADAE